MNITICEMPKHMVVDLITSSFGLDMVSQTKMQMAAVSATKMWCGWAGDDLLGVLGLVEPSFCSNEAYVWMHTTPAVADHAFMFVLQSRRLLKEIRKTYPILKGHTHRDAEQSQRWLKLLGAEYSYPVGDTLAFQIGNSK